MLRYAFVDKLEIEQVASIYGVHRTTAGRRLTAAREKLIAYVRDELAKKLRVPQKELESILHLIQSRLSLSLERLLKRDAAV